MGNDGQAVFDSLIRASAAQMTAAEAMRATLKVLRSISGPFAFVFLDKIHCQIYFGRDRLGRRSLLYKNGDNSMEFASVAESFDGLWREVEADGIYEISCCDEISNCMSQESNEDIFSTSVLPLRRHSWDTEDSLVRLPAPCSSNPS
jgi:asparagine synthetase B (glutamine-hydrolysing)